MTPNGATTGVELLGRRIELPLATSVRGAGKLVLRPHQMTISAGPTAYCLPAEVTYAAYLGNQVQYSLETQAGPLFASVAPRARPFAVGEHVHVGFDPADLRIVPA